MYVREIGHLVRAEQEAVVRSGEAVALLIAACLRLKSIRGPSMRRRTGRHALCRQQDGLRRSDSVLVCDQRVIRTAAVTEMLVNVDDGFAGGLPPRSLNGGGLWSGCEPAVRRAQQRKRRDGEEIASFQAMRSTP